MSTDMQTAVKSDQSKINIDLETGEENIEYIDNPEVTDIQNLSTEEQRKILEKYGAEKVTEVLEKSGIESLNELTKDDLEDFEKELKNLSLLGERYKNVTFENTQTGMSSSFDIALNRCKKYCEMYIETIKNEYGIYLFGDKGVGKTHLTACMSNFFVKVCTGFVYKFV